MNAAASGHEGCDNKDAFLKRLAEYKIVRRLRKVLLCVKPMKYLIKAWTGQNKCFFHAEHVHLFKF